jgi:phospholipid transport system substrate-binding protein
MRRYHMTVLSIYTRPFFMLVAALLALCSQLGFAEATQPAKEPQAIVEKVTQELFALVKAKKANNTSDEAYYEQVKGSLDAVVNFSFIAAAVMGKQAFDSASPEQRTKFLDVFKNGLVKSYAKGIAGYVDSQTKVVGVVADKKNPKRVTVQQEVTYEGATHKLDYTMVQGKDDAWKLINVTLNGVNLGVSFQGQFKSYMRKYNNNLDQVIANWLAES